MALETERCSPNNASSPGPTDNNRRPGLDDCSDQTKEVSPHAGCKTPPPTPSATLTTIDAHAGDGRSVAPATVTTTSAFRSVREDAAVAADNDDHHQRRDDDDDDDTDDRLQRTPADAALLLACSKPLSICSPLQNKTAADKVLHAPQPSPPQLQQHPMARKKPSHQVQKPNASTDVPRWLQQQQHHPQHNTAAAIQNAEPPPPPQQSASAAAAAVEYTMAMAAAAAAAAAAGQVPPVFPFNSWMYRFNFLPIVPAAAAEYFREMQHNQRNGVGSPETDEQQPVAHHLHLPIHQLQHQQQLQHVELAMRQQQQQQQQLTTATSNLHHPAAVHLMAGPAHRTVVAVPQPVTLALQQPVVSSLPPQPVCHQQPLPPPPQPPMMHSLPPPPTTALPLSGYVSRPTSTSGSSDVSSSCGTTTNAPAAATGVTNTKNFCRSPSPRSPSPFPLAFSVDNILRPEFGSKLHHLQHHILNHHHNNRGRQSSASPPPMAALAAAAAKLHHNKSLQQHLQRATPLSQPAVQSLLRPAPTRPKSAAVGLKRSAAGTAVAADKVKRKPAPSSSPGNCINNNNNNNSMKSAVMINGGDSDSGGHHHKSDESANNNNNNDNESGSDAAGSGDQQSNEKELWPAWVYCTRYSDRPSSGKDKTLISV